VETYDLENSGNIRIRRKMWKHGLKISGNIRVGNHWKHCLEISGNIRVENNRKVCHLFNCAYQQCQVIYK